MKQPTKDELRMNIASMTSQLDSMTGTLLNSMHLNQKAFTVLTKDIEKGNKGLKSFGIKMWVAGKALDALGNVIKPIEKGMTKIWQPFFASLETLGEKIGQPFMPLVESMTNWVDEIDPESFFDPFIENLGDIALPGGFGGPGLGGLDPNMGDLVDTVAEETEANAELTAALSELYRDLELTDMWQDVTDRMAAENLTQTEAMNAIFTDIGSNLDVRDVNGEQTITILTSIEEIMASIRDEGLPPQDPEVGKGPGRVIAPDANAIRAAIAQRLQDYLGGGII
jgi:hypothetical protein